jgi:hypothetical protein
MDISTYLSGGLSGSGAFCYKNPFGGGTTTVDLTVSGNRNAGNVTLSFAASTSTFGISLLSIAMGPELALHGGYATSPANTLIAGVLVNGAATAVTLSGGSDHFPVALNLQRGAMARFTSACASLSPLSIAG